MAKAGELLVAIINNHRDFLLAQDEHWYRIPAKSVRKWLRDKWPPRWLAFYQTKIFQQEAFSVRYYAKVERIKERFRWEILPEEADHSRSQERYYQLWLTPLQQLPQPIFSRRRRRIMFIASTWQKFVLADEINDLYQESPLEELLWSALKRWHITAERQEFLTIKDKSYALDFSVYCAKGQLGIETDGDTWHANPEKAALDNHRNNALEAAGWSMFHFTTQQIREEMAAYCVPILVEAINKFGGVQESDLTVRKFDPKGGGVNYQLSLFD